MTERCPGIKIKNRNCMNTLFRLFAGFLCLLALTACKHTVEMQFDLGGESGAFFANGFPTDLRVKPDGRLDLRNFPRQSHGMTRLYVETVQADIQGYSPIMPAYLPFTGPIAMAQLPQMAEAYAQADSPLQWVDVDPSSPERGRRFPLTVSMTVTADLYRPAHLLQALPLLGYNLRPNTQYALIATDQLPIAAANRLQQSAVLARLLQPHSPGEQEQRAWELFTPLRDWLKQEGIRNDRVVAATVWTTGDPAQTLFDAAHDIATWPVPVSTPLQTLADFPDYCVLGGQWQVPGFQVGVPPYAYSNYGGGIDFDRNGAPRVQYLRSAPFVVTIPRQSMPAEGFPLLMYNHGTGGDSQQVFARGKSAPDGTIEVGGGPARIAAQRGWAASGMGGHLALEHMGILGSADGYMAYNLFNPLAMRNNFVQMVLERVLFRRLLNTLIIDPSLCAGVQLPEDQTHIRFSESMQALMGQSLGSYTAGMQAAVDPLPVQGVILTGAGGSWIEFVFGPTVPVNLQILVEVAGLQLPLIQHLDRWHPIPMLAELAMGVADNLHFADTLLRYPKKEAPHVLVIEGHSDHQVPENIQRPLLRALGVDLVGDEVGVDEDDTVYPAIGVDADPQRGARQLGYPAQANRQIDGQAARTAVVVRYAADTTAGLDGHHVTFQRDEPKHQYGCFLQTLAEGRAPVVVQGSVAGGDCL